MQPKSIDQPVQESPPEETVSWSGRVLFSVMILAMIALWGVHAWAYRWLCDDAYISFRYVRQWMRGEGLVFNPGEWVEGYTNFLWIVELYGLWRLTGYSPVDTAWVLSAFWSLVLVAALAWVSMRSVSFSQGAWVFGLLLGWLAVQPHVAVWSTSGLETRQFTALLVLGVALITTPRVTVVQCFLASFVIGLAALTRPEGLMLFAVCGVWVVVVLLMQKRSFVWGLLAFALPFLLIVGAHFYFRYTCYGEWLPNTYYAKHVRAWPEAGLSYVYAFVLETGLYAVLPLGLIGAWWRWMSRRDGFLWLAPGLLTIHCGYVVTIGGDHFIYRPFDWYFPVLFLAAAEGTVALMRWIAGIANRSQEASARAVSMGVGSLLFVLLAAYTTFVPVASTVVGASVVQYERGFNPVLTRKNAPYLFWLPGMSRSVEGVNRSRESLVEQGIGVRWREHKLLWEDYLRFWEPYEAMAGQGVIPDDAVAAFGTVGIMPYHLIDLTVIDTFGLTDKTVARNPVTKPNSERYMAHDREVPFGYLESRGFNFSLAPAASTLEEGFARAHFVYRVSDTLWMPFDSGYHDWVQASFDESRLFVRMALDDNVPNRNRTFFNGQMYQGRAFLGRFDNGLDGWTAYGDAMTNQPATGSRTTQMPVLHFAGQGLVNSFHAERLDEPTGWVRSPRFTPQAGDMLQFLIAGGSRPRTGVRLWVGEDIAGQWHGRDGEVLGPVQVDLNAYAGMQCHVEIYDEDRGAWGHVLADHFVLMTPSVRL